MTCDTEGCDREAGWAVRDATVTVGHRTIPVGDVNLCTSCMADLRRTGRLRLGWARIVEPEALHPALRPRR